MEQAIERLATHETELNERMTEAASDYAQLAELQSQLESLLSERGELEMSWLELSEALEA